jgi:hypothetical protein
MSRINDGNDLDDGDDEGKEPKGMNYKEKIKLSQRAELEKDLTDEELTDMSESQAEWL